MNTKKIFALLTALAMLLTNFTALAEGSAPPAMPEGMGQPPERTGEGPGGTPPDGMPGNPPDGMGGPGGMPGGSSRPESYDAVNTYAEDADITDETLESTGTDENAVLVTDGSVTLENVTVKRTSDDSTGGDSASFYGVGAALLVTGGTLTVSNSEIVTDARGGAGVFAYGEGTAVVTDTTISTAQDTSGGIHVAGGGTIRSDRGSGTLVVDGGSYTSNGQGSPAVYVTADITIHGADLTATGSEALCLEGLNTVRLYDCNLSGDMPDQEQNDNTWTVILYQSMSGDSEVGEGRFEMVGGSLTSANGGLFYTTNTESEFVLSGVQIKAAEDSEYFLRCTGNSNRRGWGQTGANGADCTFTAIAQEMDGDVIWDSISTLNLYVTGGSVLRGAVIDDESCAGTGGDGSCTLVIDEGSTWVVTGNSTVTNLSCAGTIRDAAGNAVSIVDADGAVLAEGTSEYTVTVNDYSTACDLSGAGSAASWSETLFAAD